jgi:hypothetical protein
MSTRWHVYQTTHDRTCWEIATTLWTCGVQPQLQAAVECATCRWLDCTAECSEWQVVLQPLAFYGFLVQGPTYPAVMNQMFMKKGQCTLFTNSHLWCTHF